jgi:hypothetical protein
MRILINILIFSVLIFSGSCQEKDDVPPVLTLNGQQSINHPLNKPYADAGAKADDDRDGDITSNIYSESDVNENLIGEYTVVYRVVDNAGNEAESLVRNVKVINEGWVYMGNYDVWEKEVFPETQECLFTSSVNADSGVNWRLSFTSFGCNGFSEIYADVSGASIIMPYQVIQDLLTSSSFQGSGWINDTIITMSYQRKGPDGTSYWNGYFYRK